MHLLFLLSSLGISSTNPLGIDQTDDGLKLRGNARLRSMPGGEEYKEAVAYDK